MRGILNGMFRHIGLKGITPAHAGNTCLYSPYNSTIWDHPRACGEYQKTTRLYMRKQGSPPRMRGIPQEDVLRLTDIGITPAHAGNTLFCDILMLLYRDHPRACGEYTKKSHDIAVHLARNPNFYLVSKFTRMES